MRAGSYQEGDVAFVRVTVLETWGDVLKVRVDDFPRYAVTFWAPASQLADPEQVAGLELVMPR